MHGFSLFSWRRALWSSFASDSGKQQHNTWNASKYLPTLSYKSYVFLHEILQRRENAETWDQKMVARDSELVARNRERTIKLMQNKQLINRKMTLMIYCKDVAKGWSGRTLHHTASSTSKSSTDTICKDVNHTWMKRAKLSNASGWTWAYCFPSWPWNKISKYGLGKKIITESRQISLAKSRINITLITFW